MYVLNTEQFGYVVKSQEYKDLADVSRHFLNFKMGTLGIISMGGLRIY